MTMAVTPVPTITVPKTSSSEDPPAHASPKAAQATTTPTNIEESVSDTKSTGSTSSNTSDSNVPRTSNSIPLGGGHTVPVVKRSLSLDGDKPLPSARELSKVLCRIIDTEVYNDEEAEIALKTLKHWASKQNVSFGNHFADVGGLQQVLFFVEDNMDDCNCIAPALMLLETLCKPVVQGSISLKDMQHNIYESKALSAMRTKIGKCIVDVGGVDLMLRTFQYHALNKNAGKPKSTANALVKPDGTWSVMNMMSCCTTEEEPDPRVLEEQQKLKRIQTARHSMEVLVLLIPHVIGVDKDAPTKILETLSDAVPELVPSKGHKRESQDLVASVTTCLVATTAIASKDTLAGPKLQRAKKIVKVANTAMQEYPKHHGINRDGCILLQSVCRHLPKSERKRLGVVASLGSVVASETIHQDIKDIADEILEELFLLK